MNDAVQDSAIVPPHELVARARALAPGFRERQDETEAARAVPQISIEECARADLFRVLQPRRYGGFEHGLDAFVPMAAAVASGCGSTGWVYSVAAQHQWLVGLYPPEGQDELWADDPTALVASSFAPTGVAVPVEGGYRLTGRWMYCSGIENCEWIMLGARIAPSLDADPVDQGYILAPTSAFDLEDDWHVVGLAGTGSKTAVCADLFVPGPRFLHLEDALSGTPPGAAVNPGPLFRIPFYAAVSVCLSAAVIGMAQGAYDEFVTATRERVTRGAALSKPMPMAQLPTIQLRIGEAAACIDAARLLLERDCRDIMAAMAAGEAMPERMRARNKGDLGFVMNLATRGVDRLFESGGGGALFRQTRLQRFWRDAHAGAMHVSTKWDIVGALYGRVELGLPPEMTQF